jgi:hypothetical protein
MEPLQQPVEAYQPDGSNLGHALGSGVREIGLIGGIWLGTKAGRNHYARTHDLSDSIWLGAIAGRRWFVWIVACFLTLTQGALGAWFVSYVNSPGFHDFSENGDARSYAYAFVLGPCLMVPILAVLYNRNIDYSLFQRRLAYWLTKPLAVVLDWLPNGILYSMLIVLPLTIAYLA